MKSKHIILTFDFELFLGARSGSVENCLIKPTVETNKIINKFNISTIYFVDTLYLHRLEDVAKKNKAASDDYNKILALLRTLIDSGNYIFHHIHPHWLDAKYLEDTNEWDLSDKTKFALINLTAEETEYVFSISNAVISEIYNGKTAPIFSGFRAGGLYAQPFDHYKKQMLKNRIRIDFSVLKNSKSSGDNGRYSFDYSVFPKKDIYTFSEDILKKDESGYFIEIMMDMFKLSGLSKIINGIYYRMNFRKKSWQRWGDGKASGNVLKSTKASNKFLSEETYSIELLNNYKAGLYFKKIKETDFMHIISHPKLLSPNNLKALEYFLSQLKSSYEIETDIFKILEMHEIKLDR